MLTVERLRELLSYDPLTGMFIRKITTSHNAKAGEVAGTINTDGYVVISLNGKPYYGHRLAWLWEYEAWPVGQVDHRDGVRSRNAIHNLRDATVQVNRQNQRKPHRRGTSGFLGVSYNKRRGKWQAQLQVNGHRPSLGYHNTPEAAHAAYVAAKRELHEGNTL